MDNNKFDISKALSNIGISQLNQMQTDLLQKYHNHKRIILLSPTGTGKTLAYLLPLLTEIDTTLDSPQAVIIAPSRELAKQISDVATSMKTPVRCLSCYGGHTAMDEHKAIKDKKPQVIVATPGRLIDHLTKQNIDSTNIRTLVFDEFDKCLEFGFKDEILTALNLLSSIGRYLFLSATATERTASFFTTDSLDSLPAPSTFTTYDYRMSTPNRRISVHQVTSPEKDKLQTLRKLLLSFGTKSTIVFLNYREAVERTYNYLHDSHFYCEMFHGGLDQEQREKSLYKFINGTSNILVSTDLASRGLDIPEVDNIVHYHLPLNADACTHRNGRTARWEASGNSYFLTGPDENMPPYSGKTYDQYYVYETDQQPQPPLWTTIYIGKGKKSKLSKFDILGFLCKQGGLQSDEVGRIDIRDNYTFVAVSRHKVRQLLTSVQGQKIKGVKTIIQEAR